MQRVRRRSTPAGYDNTSEFFYAPDRSRYKRVDRVLTLGGTSNIFRSGFEFAESDPAGVPRTYRFVGNVEFAVENGVEVVRRSIGGFLVHRRTAGGGASYEWRLSDGLGSVDALVNGAPGASSFRLVQRMSFDAFGMRRDAYSGTWETQGLGSTLAGSESNITLRGYTGHEQVDPVGMIHMNGRLYDPRIGRFVQADPVVDDGLDGQAYNRYSYVTNNPLRYTDPSGYRRSGHARSAGVALLSLIVFNVAAPAAMPGWLWSAIQGATVGAVGTGSSSGAAWGAVSGLTFHGIGALKLGPDVGTPFAKVVSDGGYWAKVSLHAAAGGTLNDLQGGDFGHGFVTAGVSAGVSPLIDRIGDGRAKARPARIVVQALVGGAVSKGIGGDFGAGALLAAIGRVMNAESALSEMEQELAARRALYADTSEAVGEMEQRASEYGDAMADGYALAVPVPVAKVGLVERLRRWWAGLDKVSDATKQLTVAFGRNADQLQHAFRHTDALGLARADVETAIRNHLPTVAGAIPKDGPLNSVIEVAGQRIQYTAYRLPDGTINIGRIHGLP